MIGTRAIFSGAPRLLSVLLANRQTTHHHYLPYFVIFCIGRCLFKNQGKGHFHSFPIREAKTHDSSCLQIKTDARGALWSGCHIAGTLMVLADTTSRSYLVSHDHRCTPVDTQDRDESL